MKYILIFLLLIIFPLSVSANQEIEFKDEFHLILKGKIHSKIFFSVERYMNLTSIKDRKIEPEKKYSKEIIDIIDTLEDLIATIDLLNKEVEKNSESKGINHFLNSCDCPVCKKILNGKMPAFSTPFSMGRKTFSLKKLVPVYIYLEKTSFPGIRLILNMPHNNKELQVVVDKDLNIYSFYMPGLPYFIKRDVRGKLQVKNVDPNTIKFDNKEKIKIKDFSIDSDNKLLFGKIFFPEIQKKEYPAAIIFQDSGPYNHMGISMMGDNVNYIKRLIEYLNKNGIAVVSFDKRGTGQSSGTGNLPFKERIKDSIAIFDYVKKIPNINQSSLILIGVGTSCMEISNILKTNKVWCTIFIYPPLPDLYSYYKTLYSKDSNFIKAIEKIYSMTEFKPFLFNSQSGKLIWMTSNPRETSDLINYKIDIELKDLKTPALFILKDKTPDFKKNNSSTYMVDKKNDPEEFLRAILKFLEFLSSN